MSEDLVQEALVATEAAIYAMLYIRRPRCGCAWRYNTTATNVLLASSSEHKKKSGGPRVALAARYEVNFVATKARRRKLRQRLLLLPQASQRVQHGVRLWHPATPQARALLVCEDALLQAPRLQQKFTAKRWREVAARLRICERELSIVFTHSKVDPLVFNRNLKRTPHKLEVGQ